MNRSRKGKSTTTPTLINSKNKYYYKSNLESKAKWKSIARIE